MTTVQEAPNGNGHRLFPPPFFVENAVELNRVDLPTDKANSHSHIDTQKLPDRCQFSFSDGRQCTMARSDIHPSLCRFHAEREDQLFGDPSPAGCVVGRALDLPELYSACRDLNTAAGVNRALTLVFRLLAQRRISRQEAATFGHLAQLLLRTISLMRAESADATSENKQPMIPVVERQKGVAITPLLPHDKVPSSQHEDVVCNSTEINRYENSQVKTVQNQHLHNDRDAAERSRQGRHNLAQGGSPGDSFTMQPEARRGGTDVVAQVVLPKHFRQET